MRWFAPAAVGKEILTSPMMLRCALQQWRTATTPSFRAHALDLFNAASFALADRQKSNPASSQL